MSVQDHNGVIDGLLDDCRTDRDDVRYHAQWCDRWQKHGHDRIYFNDTQLESWNGYVDLNSGAVEGDTPIESVEVVDGRVEYQAENGDEIVSRPL